MRYLLLLTFFVPLLCSGYDIGGVNLKLLSPDSSLEEACLDKNTYDYVSKSTDAQSSLITCYANTQEWSEGNGTIVHKVEIIKEYQNKTFDELKFEKEVNKLYDAIRKYNNFALKNSGKLTDSQINMIDSIKKSSDINVDFEVKNTLMTEIDSSKNHVILSNSNSIIFNGKTMKTRTLICFMNVKGKMITLRSINTKQEQNSSNHQLATLKKWIAAIKDAN
ncbi:MAG: hypothetical protein V4805_08315 [Pseudomonadota bacterium]